MAPNDWMIYGATGYTGELIARAAHERGLRPVLGGRDPERVAALAADLGLEARAFALGGEGEAGAALSGMRAVLHCAGPFVRTSAAMAGACLAARCHYLDITGEIPVFEALFARDREARVAGVVLLPGVGFDVVPTDCLARRLAEALPGARELTLAVHSAGGRLSGGTLKTMIESLPHAGAVRRGGRLVPVPLAWDARQIDFPCGPRWAMTIPWGDLATAYRSTGIPDIRVYAGAPPRAIRRARALRPLLPLAGRRPVKRLLQWWVGRGRRGPGPEERRRVRAYVWGEARDAAGRSVAGALSTPEPYSFTAEAALAATQRVLAGDVGPGSWTPAQALGAGFVAGLPEVEVGELRG